MQRTIIKVIIILLLFGISGCSSSKTAHTDATCGELSIIFQQLPNQMTYTWPSGAKTSTPYSCPISYLDSSGMWVDYCPKEGVDTLTIPISTRYIEVRHQYRALENIYYLFAVGDTITFTYDSKGYPTAISSFGTEQSVQYNFVRDVANRSSFHGLEAYSLLSLSSIWQMDYIRREKPDVYNNVFKRRHNDYLPIDSLKAMASAYKQNYLSRLKSLHDEGVINRDYYNYYTYLLGHKEKMASLTAIQHATAQEKERLTLAATSYLNDSLFSHIPYHSYVKLFLTSVEFTKPNVPSIRESGGSFYDARIAFQNIEQQSHLGHKTKQLLLYYCLSKIIDNFSGADIETYVSAYTTATSDSTGAIALLKKHEVNLGSNTDLLLASEQGDTLTFNSLLQKHKGKVVYVDFWASWCAPCRQAMPVAKQLREEFKDKAIVFIYLAFNDREKAWREAVKKYEVDYLSESYLILNSKTSQLIEELEVKTIPRYLLFDRQGKLVHRNAPDAASGGLRKLLSQYLAD